ncbi:MAG: hypothetical protein P8R43_09055 [Planctomycetota bacterium]|nr:hypothetical protein [Planctomycetota bacterium]
MSQTPQKPGATTSKHHEDDLIVVPEGKSRLRYIATIGLVLFLLVIFVVADTFQSALTGGGGGDRNPVYVTWTDPITKEPREVKESDFSATTRDLSMMASLGFFGAYSVIFSDPLSLDRGNQGPTEEDVASFLVLEGIATSMGLEVSNEEHKERLRSRFGDDAGLRNGARLTRMPVEQLEELVRRCGRVQKVSGQISRAMQVPDAAAIEAKWLEENPLFKFNVVTNQTDQYTDQARAEAPDDETLVGWFHGRPLFEQQALFSPQTVTADVAYVPLGEGAAFDAAALLAAYPAPEGTDLEGQANSYYNAGRALRFGVPAELQMEAIIGEDGEEIIPAAPKLFYELEEVREQVDVEAPIYAAMRAWLTDLQDRRTQGEEADFAAEAASYGLTFEAGPEGGLDREAIGAQEPWGTPMIAGQLTFAQEGAFLPSVMMGGKSMTIALARAKKDREEPPFADIRDEVLELWAVSRSKEIAVETLDGVRLVLAAKPEDLEVADWRPEIDLDELRQLTAEAGYTVVERDWLGQNAVPNDDFAAATPLQRFLRGNVDMHALEAGQVAPAVASPTSDEVFLVRMEGKKSPPIEEIGALGLLQARQVAISDSFRATGAKIFPGDSEWMTETAMLRFPERERRDAEKEQSAK